MKRTHYRLLPEVRGDVLLAWRSELRMTRSAAARLFGLNPSSLRLHEGVTEEERQKGCLRTKEWNKNNPERKIENSLRWQEENWEKHLEHSRKHYHSDLERSHEKHNGWYHERREKRGLPPRRKGKDEEKARERNRVWRRVNRDLTNATTRKRRARKANAYGTCSVEQATARIEFYGGMCAYCRVAPHEQLDHVIPLARGGTNWPSNFRPSCKSCNLSKNDSLLSEWKKRPLAVSDAVNALQSNMRPRTIRKHKLSVYQVKEIRTLLAQGVKIKVLSIQFGVNQSAISKIKHRERWGHI